MLNAKNPIGVMDSGIGGLTVVKELQRILPGEDIIYFGDSANCPYGNKTSDQIFELSCNMLKFLGDNGVKCTAIACNTISTMSNRLRPCFDYRIVSIVEEAAKYVIREKLSSVGLIATEFTVASGKYAELVHEGNPECKVVGKGSPLLAALVDRGDFNQHDINLEITTQVDNILAREKVEHLILGCTHYPIVEDNFRQCYPGMKLINPALEQANAVKEYLTEQNAVNPQKKGTFTICTSGDPQVYVNVGKRLGLFEASELKVVHL
ncbi:MAG: glutamate racemase [Oscillospiraceae bacterium]|nr:glutamate racemase [Oscillospiraceae bacterium]